jgi:GMP synthase (glutamine-hydrolysing)
MAWQMKGTVEQCDHREYGFANVKIAKVGGPNPAVDALFEGLGDEMQVPTNYVSLLPDSPLRRSGCPTATSSPPRPPTFT